MGRIFNKHIFENEPSENTSLDADTLNDIQDDINLVLLNSFGGTTTKYSDNVNNSINDGIYIIDGDYSNLLPFTPNIFVPSTLIVLTRPDIDGGKAGDRATQIAIDGSTNDLYIRQGFIRSSSDQKYFKADLISNNGWRKIETTNIISNGIVQRTNIYLSSSGKYVYVKRFIGNALPNNSSIDINIEINDSVSLYKIEGVATNTVTNNQTPIPFSGNNSMSVYYVKNSKAMHLETNSDRRNWSYVLDFYFTYDD